jgi:sarcosine oxidase subunit alpha
MAVVAQNAWPSLDFDLKAANRWVGRFLAPGFYYKTFMKPQRLWPIYQRVLRRFAAGGTLDAETPPAYFDKKYAHADVVVAGGGPAGMAAAVAAAEAGARVLLIEEEPALGGHLRFGNTTELAALAELRHAVAATPGLQVLVDTVVTGRYDDNWIAAVERGVPGVAERLWKIRGRTLVVTPGLVERPYVFAGNDLPGVMLSTGVRRLVNLWAVRPGERAVVFTANAAGDAAADDLARVGVEVARIVDARAGEGVVRARGRRGVEAVELADGSTVACDLLVTAVGWTAPTSLLNMAGDRPVWDAAAARFRPGAGLPRTVLAAGGLAGDASLAGLVAHARAIGRQAAAVAAGRIPGVVPALPVDRHPALFRSRTHGFVDCSEDVTSKDVIAAAREGYDSIELVKRYTTATMGAAQGKLETINLVAVLAEARGESIADVGTTVWRPPYAPVTLGALAGRMFEPIRRSPMHAWHEAHGARPLVAGQWIRPEHYGDPAAEVRNVRRNVGLIDVTPLGKLDLRGPDVPKLLGLVYVNKWTKLDVGAVRYGVMCADDGVVLDDGVTGRLAPDRWLMSTTSSGADAVYEWIESWLQTEHPDWRVFVTPVTNDYASMNVAGPRARDLLRRVADGVDLSPAAFPYMQVRTARVAGVDGCVMWRIGFTGELSYELHVPASYGLHVWEALLAAGADLGAAPFGVEAQRIMRLEKGHAIVGQDTDGLTRAGSAALGGLVKLDKDDFAGKPELAWAAAERPDPLLVALQPVDGAIVPAEASLLVEDERRIVGRVTSSRMSPTLGRSICLGFVAAHLAAPGTAVTIQLPDGARVPATVMPTLAHFDPEGSRLRG